MLPVLARNQSTLLVIRPIPGTDGIALPLYSARGLQQTLEPIAAANMQRRTVNGVLINLSPPPKFQFNAYKTSITGADQELPAVDGVWPGAICAFECIVELAIGPSGQPRRPAVPGSLRTGPNGVQFYRPVLIMMVTGLNLKSDEWGAAAGWTLDAEEVETGGGAAGGGAAGGGTTGGGAGPPPLVPPPVVLPISLPPLGPPPVTMTLSFNPVLFKTGALDANNNPIMSAFIPSTTPLGTTVGTVVPVNSDGSVFAGRIFFAAPNFDAGGIFALSGNDVIINPHGPGVAGIVGTVIENITLDATP